MSELSAMGLWPLRAISPSLLLLFGCFLEGAAAEPLFEMYAVTPYQAGGDVYCPGSAANGYEYTQWAEYFGGCEGRQCKRSSDGDILVHHFRCRPGTVSPSRQCRSQQEDSFFPDCCLPVCSDALY
ncbi:uncharacterized protein LOC144119252 [Amblyomma americanum]